MVAANFPRALKLVLVDEGGRDDDPHDHGGRTAYGIIQREYDGYRLRHNLPKQDVWKITPAEYSEIYKDRYWEPWCDRLPPGVDYAFFDNAVNTGPGQAAKTLQKAMGIRVDGFMGDVTLGRAKQLADQDVEDLISRYCDARRAFYRALAQFPRYGRGWLARVDHVEKAAKAMSAEPAPTQEAADYYDAITRNGLSDDLKDGATARAKAEDTKQAPVSVPTAATTATASGIGAGYLEQLSTISDKLEPFKGVIHGIEYVLLSIAFISIGMTLYSTWHNAKIKEAVG